MTTPPKMIMPAPQMIKLSQMIILGALSHFNDHIAQGDQWVRCPSPKMIILQVGDHLGRTPAATEGGLTKSLQLLGLGPRGQSANAKLPQFLFRAHRPSSCRRGLCQSLRLSL
jgi:hypothetical protein